MTYCMLAHTYNIKKNARHTISRVMSVKYNFFSSSEMRTCLQNHPVAFIGDSRTRTLYYELVQTVSLNSVKDEGKSVSCQRKNNIDLNLC